MKPTERNKRIAAACRALGDEGCEQQLKLLAEMNPDSSIFWDEDLREAEIVFGRTVITVSVGSEPLLADSQEET